MPITIDELNAKYGKEDKNWQFKLFFTWLSKKGIPNIIIQSALKQALADYSEDTLPPDHHTFDQTILMLARILQENSEEEMTKALENSLTDKLKNYEADWNSLSKMKKLWEVIRGRA